MRWQRTCLNSRKGGVWAGEFITLKAVRNSWCLAISVTKISDWRPDLDRPSCHFPSDTQWQISSGDSPAPKHPRQRGTTWFVVLCAGGVQIFLFIDMMFSTLILNKLLTRIAGSAASENGRLTLTNVLVTDGQRVLLRCQFCLDGFRRASAGSNNRHLDQALRFAARFTQNTQDLPIVTFFESERMLIKNNFPLWCHSARVLRSDQKFARSRPPPSPDPVPARRDSAGNCCRLDRREWYRCRASGRI